MGSETRPAMVFHPADGNTVHAECPCGWVGPERDTEEAAFWDAQCHDCRTPHDSKSGPPPVDESEPTGSSPQVAAPADG